MNAGTSRRTGGFTLLEIMVALAIFGIVVAAIYASWSAIVRGAETGKKAAAAVQRSRFAIRTLEAALMSARSFDASRDYYYFIGENGSDATLSFVSKLPQSFAGSRRFREGLEVRRVEFKLEPGDYGDYGKRLVLRQWPIVMREPEINERQNPVVLAKNVKDFEMRFWDEKEQDYIDEWTQTNLLPRKVEITLRWSRESSQRYPSSGAEQETVFRVFVQSGSVPARWQTTGR
jgi:general secretion pathway protein J